MIETEDLSKQFGDFTAVDGVSLQVGKGQVLGLLGPNGAGKTTTVRMLASILFPTRGWARVAGYDVTRYPRQVRAMVGVLTENHGLYNRMPAGEYLDFFGQIYNLSSTDRKTRSSRLLEQFGLAEYTGRRLGEYSKGMRQKLALARALLHEPAVLLLDEPTSAMDPESARLVRDSIRELRSAERTIVICTHNLAEAEELSDQIAIIRRGRIIALGSPQALKLRLLGPAEFEVRWSVGPNGGTPSLPAGVQFVHRDHHCLRFQTSDPENVNPRVVSSLIEQGFGVVTLQETPRNLEEVYIKAVTSGTDGI